MDLGWTQATWDKLFQRIGLVTSIYHLLDRIRDELKRNDIIVEEYFDPAGLLQDWILSGIDLFNNTDGNGLLYVEVSSVGYGNYEVVVYKDSGLGLLDEVCSGIMTGGLVPETISLTESNDSGITGTVTVAAGGTSSVIWLRPRVGLLRQIETLPVDDAFDGFLQADMMSVLTNVIGGLGTSMSKVESFTKRQLIPWIRNKIDSQESTYEDPIETVSGGTVSYENQGVLADFIDAMNDDTVAGAQTIECPTAGSISEAADADNVGVGTIGTPTWFQYAEECTITLECVTETIGSEAFTVIANRTKDGVLIEAQNNLTVKKTYLSTDIGIKSMTLARTIVPSGAENDHFDQWAFSGETSVNTDDGVLYCSYDSATKILSIYSDAGRANLVAEGTWDGIDGSTCTLVEQNDSGLSGSVRISKIAAADPATTITLEVDLQVFKEGDKIYIEYSRSDDMGRQDLSKFELFFGRLFTTELPGNPVPPPTIEDEYANRGYSGLETELYQI